VVDSIRFDPFLLDFELLDVNIKIDEGVIRDFGSGVVSWC
jgi:hypothetical protein